MRLLPNPLSIYVRGRTLPATLRLGAIFVSVFLFVFFCPHLSGPLTANLDPDRFDGLASNINNGYGFIYARDSTHVAAQNIGPRYPYLLALIYTISHSEGAYGVQAMQAVLHGLTGLLVFSIGCKVFDRRIALTAQAIHAVHPILVWYSARIQVETTHTMLVTAAVHTLTFLPDQPNRKNAAILGAALALCVLTKSVLLLLPVLLVAYAATRSDRRLGLAIGGA